MQKSTLMMLAAALSGAPALAVAANTTTSAATGSVSDAPVPNYADSVARLKEATQRLREAIQNISQQAPGDRRNAAIRDAQRALFDAQQAMLALPPEVFAGEVPEAQPNYTRAMERLQQSAQKLRESVQAMADQPSGPRRNAAARQAREAIVETQQAMIDLPPQLRSQAGAKSATNAGRVASSIPRTFSELDRNNDGFLDMIEAASDKDAQQNFKALDKNGDYKLSRSEWEAGHPPAAGGSPPPKTSTKK